MTKKERKALLTFQQGELNAVVMYKRLAELVKSDELKAELQTLAAEEGKHASILKSLSDTVLKPKNTMKNPVVLGYRFLGRKAMFKIIAKFEKASYGMYKKYFDVFPETVAIAEDEVRHGETLLKLVKTKL